MQFKSQAKGLRLPKTLHFTLYAGVEQGRKAKSDVRAKLLERRE